MLAFLLDDRYYRSVLPGEPPILFSSDFGVATRTQPIVVGRMADQLAHPDDLLCACAEVGLPTDTTIWTRSAEGRLESMVRSAAMRVQAQQELEWTVEALARYLLPTSEWENRFGERLSLEKLAIALCDAPIGSGACLGTHKPYTAAALLRINEECPFLSKRSQDALREYLLVVLQKLRITQFSDGGWRATWAGPTVTAEEMTNEYATIVATGHHLEWIAIAPADCLPTVEMVRAAIQAIYTASSELAGYRVMSKSRVYVPLSHCARAICLLGGVDPMSVAEATADYNDQNKGSANG